MTHRTTRQRNRTTGWQLEIPMPRQPGADERDELTEEIRTSPAFTHIVGFLHNAKDLGLDVSKPSVIQRAVEAGNKAYAEQLSRESHRNTYAPLKVGYRDSKHSPVVYYMRRDTLVKIGFSEGLRQRTADINPDGIMVIEPGGFDVEAMRHSQFAEHCRRGEWFHLQGSLVDHILDLRARFEKELGQSFEAWWEAYRQRVPARRSSGPNLPEARVGEHPELGDLVTAELAALATGKTAHTVRQWAHQKKLQPVARAGRSRLYRLADVLGVAGQIRHWHANGPAHRYQRPQNGNLHNG